MTFKFKADKWFNNRVSEDLFDMVAGELLGKGVYRNVYTFLPDDSLVLKVETDSGSFANIREYQMWTTYSYNKKLSKWFAPCVQLSNRGQFLLQKKVGVIDGRKLPDKIPPMIADGHLGNWGIYEDRVVCCDYGNHRSHEISSKEKFVNAQWSKK